MTTDKVFLTEEVKKRWEPVLEGEGFDSIQDASTKRMVNIVLENMLQEAPNGGTDNTINNTGDGSYEQNGRLDPVLIKLVRRAMPALIANDLVGVQPMTGPTGLIFALRSYYGGDTTGTEAFQPGVEADSDWSGSGKTPAGAGTGDTLLTPEAELLGQGSQTDSTSASTTEPVVEANPWNEMSFSIEKSMVSAESRALKARYTTELAQDLRVTHGLDAATELSNILATEIVTEQNRELVNILYAKAGAGAQDTGVSGVDVAGTFNLGSGDLSVRWEVEGYKMLLMMIVREANIIAKNTGRGQANRLVVSPEVANALDMVTALSSTAEAPGSVVQFNANTSGVGVTYAGTILSGRFKVYIDQYAPTGQILLGYKGTNIYDAGVYYCPYVPLQQFRSVGEEDFQPRIGFKTRYGIADNPFGAVNYYRKFVAAGI